MKCEECQYIGKCKEKAKESNLVGCTSGVPVEKMGIKTNGDAIRAMSNEELAEFLLKVNTAYAESCMVGEKVCKWEDYPTHDKGCKDCFKEWLESEVDNG